MEAVTRRPRNARLSAFYGLKNGSDTPRSGASPSPSAPGTPHVEPSPDGSWEADDLIKRLPLAHLVRVSTKIRNESLRIERSLHTSVLECYSQLDEAGAECRKIHRVANDLGEDKDGALNGIASAYKRCSDISADMKPIREKLENLEESRRVMLLFGAAGLLAKQLPNQFAELTELCTDPESARDRLFLTAHRCSIIAPQLRALSDDSEGFANAYAQLSSAMADVVVELHALLEEENGSLEGLSLTDVMRLRILLHITDEELRVLFLNTAGAILQSKKAAAETSRLAAGSQLSLAAFHLRHAASVIVEEINLISAAYDDTFRGGHCFVAHSKRMMGEVYEEDSVLGSDAFAVWMASTVDELVGTEIRRALASNALDNSQGEISPTEATKVDSEAYSAKHVAEFKRSVLLMREAANTDSAVPGTSLGQVPVIVGTLCDSICEQVEQAITGNVTVQVKTKFEVALFSDDCSGGRNGFSNGSVDEIGIEQKLRAVVSEVQERVEKCNVLLVELQAGDVEQDSGNSSSDGLNAQSSQRGIEVDVVRLLVSMGSDFSRRKQDTHLFCRAILRTSFLCAELANVVKNAALSRSLKEISDKLQNDFTARVVDTVSGSFRRFLFPRDSNVYLDQRVDESSIVQGVVQLVKQCREELDEYPGHCDDLHEVWKQVESRSGAGSSIGLHSPEVLDSNGVLDLVVEHWVQCVRESSLTQERRKSVEYIAADVGRSFDAADSFERVTRAAMERCIES